MVPRSIRPLLTRLARSFPLVTVTGPRQAGKTTLCRAAFPRKPYVSLENDDMREFARRDPRAFLAHYTGGAILDEVQRVPHLLSYLQAEVDERPHRGRFILTGSANFALLESVTQSLAGRTGLLTLLPLTIAEVRKFEHPPESLDDALLRGSYPAVFDRNLAPRDWYPSYVSTYLERDVRLLLHVNDLITFRAFVGVAAGRTARLLNASSIGSDVGVMHATARSWLSVLEASYVAWRLPAFHLNTTKRLVKAPKLHFYDSGLLCHLLGIRQASHLQSHPLRGAIFESWVVSEIAKSWTNRGLPPAMYHYRDRKGAEVDVVVDLGHELIAVEIKSGRTIAQDAFGPLNAFAEQFAIGTRRTRRPIRRILVYGGDERQNRTGTTILPWSDVAGFDWTTPG